jgi:hypothetical protein
MLWSENTKVIKVQEIYELIVLILFLINFHEHFPRFKNLRRYAGAGHRANTYIRTLGTSNLRVESLGGNP